jgi:PAS domain S-box-containing protein
MPITERRLSDQKFLWPDHRNLQSERDITERRKSEAQMRLQADALEATANAIVITDIKGVIEWVNPAFTVYTGYGAAEVIGKTQSLLKSGKQDEKLYQNLWDTILAGKVWRGELINKRKNGSLYSEDMTITPVRNNAGEITHFIAVKQDIPERKKLEEQFLRAQRTENIGALASGVAHDLNNILAPIMMASSMLEDDIPKETHQELVFSIQEAAQRGSDIIKQVLTFARGVEGETTTLRPELLVSQMTRILRETFPKSIVLAESMPDGLWFVSGDVTQLHQVILNLCVNARDSMMPRGGTLAITVTNIEVDENYASMSIDAKPGRYVVLKVVDSGCGISPAIIDKIFDPFFTTKELGKGTGLGLSTVVRIVRSHGGFMEVESHVGRGSDFRVFIPAAVGSQLEPIQTVCRDAPQGNGETVLIVDDEPEILKVGSMVLTKNGYIGVTANDGIEALTIYAKKSALIKVVLTDVMMPLLDGANLIRALRKINPRVQIIAASGEAEESHQNELRALGINAFLKKPFNNYQLLEAVHNAINQKAA